MRYKILIIILLMAVSKTSSGQVGEAVLDRIDFADTTMIDNDFMWQTIADYITAEQNKDADPENQMFNMILAANNVLSRSCNSYTMYSAVYQYLMYGFSELGMNPLVDYMMHLPYFENVNANESQREEIMRIASLYERVKIGVKAPDIQSVTINNNSFCLNEIDSEYTIILFWSYSCPHCRDLIAELSDLFGKDDNFAIVTVNVSGDFKKVKKLLKKKNLTEYAICDGQGWKSPIVEDYAVDMTPSLFLLDRNKVLIAKPFDIEELINELER